MVDWSKYPKTKKIMDETGLSLDELLVWTEKKIKEK